MDHLGRTRVGVKQEAARGQVGGAENVGERTPSVEAVDRGRPVVTGGECELGDENLCLFGKRCAAQADEARIVGPGAIENPAIKADLTQAGARMRSKYRGEFFQPGWGTVANIPRVQAE